jgi:hypothetical protein
MTQTYSRWHRFDTNGVKYIKKFQLNERPNPISQEGYTDWNRGTGPHSAETLHNLTIALQKACKGVPKSKETKEKMRQAKLGKPKTEQHKLNMKLSHQRRRNNDATRTTQLKQLTS